MTRTLETTAIVGADRTITVKLPEGATEGRCRLLITYDDGEPQSREPITPKLQMINLEAWPEGFTASREQLYGDDGR
jgi:hypothetical protein